MKSSTLKVILLFIFLNLNFFGRIEGQNKHVNLAQQEKLRKKRIPLVILNYVNETGDKNLDWLNTGMADMLIINLSHKGALPVIDRVNLSKIINEKDFVIRNPYQASSANRKINSENLIFGKITESSRGTLVNTYLYNQSSGDIRLYTVQIQDNTDNIIPKIDKISTWVTEKLKSSGDLSTDIQISYNYSRYFTDSKEASKYYSAGIREMIQQRYREAIEHFENAIEHDNAHAMAYAKLGACYYNEGRNNLARRNLEKALEYEKILKNNPCDYHYVKGIYYYLNEEFQKAIEEFTISIELNCYKWESFHILGNIYWMLGKYDKWVDISNRALIHGNNNPECHLLLANALNYSGRYEKALNECQKAAALKYDLVEIFIVKGGIYLNQGRYKKAYNIFDTKVRQLLGQYNPRLYLLLGVVCFFMNDYDKAIDELTRAINYESRYKPPYLYLGLSYLKKNMKNECEGILKQLKGYYQEDRFLRGKIHLAYPDYSKAIDEFENLIKSTVNLDHARNYNELGKAYYDWYKSEETKDKVKIRRAIEAFTKVFEYNPNYALAHYNLGIAYEKLADFDSAISEYEKFLEIWKKADKEIPEYKNAYLHLERLKFLKKIRETNSVNKNSRSSFQGRNI